MTESKMYQPEQLRLPHDDPDRWKDIMRHIRSPYPVDGTEFANLLKNVAVDRPELSRAVSGACKLFSADVMGDEGVSVFFENTLPFILYCITQLPMQFPSGHLDLLVTGKNHTVTLTKSQVLCLFCCGMLGILPYPKASKTWMKAQRDADKPAHTGRRGRFPSLTLVRLYASFSATTYQSTLHKLYCMLHYVVQMQDRDLHMGIPPSGDVIHYTRLVAARGHTLPDNLRHRKGYLCAVHMHDRGSIEDAGTEYLQADFANKYIGGGVVGNGCVQEEIRFAISPECLVSLTLCEVMEKNEAIVIRGTERFCAYSGYSRSFRFAGPYTDRVDHKQGAIVAVDAVDFSGQVNAQYKWGYMKRDLGKALTGFTYTSTFFGRPMRGVATGNWGCGAFKGQVALKFLIQWVAVSIAQADRPESPLTMQYYSFGDPAGGTLSDLVSYVQKNPIHIGTLWSALRSYSTEENAEHTSEGLVGFVMRKIMR